jgi:hypothetical protein
MRLKLPAIVATGLIAAVAFALPAEAAKKKRVYNTTRSGYTYVQQRPAPPATVIVTRGEDGRTRTKLLVQQRSYLDGGTEVMPGTYSAANAAWFYGQRATDALGPNAVTNPRGPIPDPFFLPGKNNPFPSF